MDLSDLTTLAKDAAYVAVGFGVIGLQRAQVRRVELTKQLDQLRTQVSKAADDASYQLRRSLTALG
ncbi:MAG: hypothetical protein QOG03_335 [Actinomycetota bacterium]|jgi:hypothetical protein|nr:hypothetical protein [Actinomycetota bacterium]